MDNSIANYISHTKEGWKKILLELWVKHGNNIETSIANDEEIYREHLITLPPRQHIFTAFQFFDIDQLRVVIIGQDPYIKRGEAHGLAFSVTARTKMPPSLKNIFKELKRTYNVERKATDLSDWAEQGVLLLNTALTTREQQSNAHAKIWKEFTKDLIIKINTISSNVVFMLWGNHAQSYAEYIDTSKHHVLKHTHPSPLARVPFEGCGHFEKANEILQHSNIQPIKWV